MKDDNDFNNTPRSEMYIKTLIISSIIFKGQLIFYFIIMASVCF